MPDGMSANEELLRDVVRAFCKHKDDVEVDGTPLPGGRGELLSLRVNRDDHPVVQGRSRRTIAALGMLFKFVGARDKQRTELILLEPVTGEQRAYGYEGEGTYDPDTIRALADRVLGRVLALPFEVEVLEVGDQVRVGITHDPQEDQLVDGLIQYCGIIFHAMGRHQGKELYLEASPAIPI